MLTISLNEYHHQWTECHSKALSCLLRQHQKPFLPIWSCHFCLKVATLPSWSGVRSVEYRDWAGMHLNVSQPLSDAVCLYMCTWHFLKDWFPLG